MPGPPAPPPALLASANGDVLELGPGSGELMKFSSSASTRELGPLLAQQARKALQADLEVVSLTNIQAWIVLGNGCGAECNYVSESLFFSIAIRLAIVMGLAKPGPEDDAVLKETKSRVWWTLFMLDRWSAAGLGTPRQMPDRQPSQQLPISEYTFQALAIGQSPWSAEEYEPGLWAYMITLAEVFGPIQDLNRLLALSSAEDHYTASTVSSLAYRLEDWQAALPTSVRLSTDSLQLHRSRGQGRTFIALHLGYHHYATLLFFQFLDHSAPTMPHASVYAERCREHASAFSDLLRTSYETSGCEAMYNIVGQMSVVSSSVLIHTLLFGEEQSLGAARARLESNFQILMKLKAWWPSVAPWADKLFLFQKACLRSADSHTHKIDHWMLKFLFEHANSLGDKADQDVLDLPSPPNFGDSLTAQRLSERNHFAQQAFSGGTT
ncbi:hypothetical protein LTR08_002883 [Meristemomyces frigidus]|nr:hypothetical protein LTR08_002883 [Meristemomyces frigidus]